MGEHFRFETLPSVIRHVRVDYTQTAGTAVATDEPPRVPTPTNLVRRFADRTFAEPAQRDLFLNAWASGRASAPALLWTAERPQVPSFEPLPPAPWQPRSVDRVPPGIRPGKTPEHDSGQIYCLDLSSVFATVPLDMVPVCPDLVVDVCAAPGGKSLLAWQRLNPEFLLCNETIAKRTGPLISNLERCRVGPAGVVSLDPAELADAVGATADLVLVDAPCSGQSLPARGMENPGCFHELTVKHNSRRQRRILAESARMVAPGGWLLYSTCTYSPEENAGVVEWFIRNGDGFSAVDVPALDAHRVPGLHSGYQLWPQEGWGAGAFCCLLKRDSTAGRTDFEPRTLSLRWQSP